MKFGRYLEDTQVPEWKKAYIDYKGLKKRIKAIGVEIESQKSSSKDKLQARFTTWQTKSSIAGPTSPTQRTPSGASGLRLRTPTTQQSNESPVAQRRNTTLGLTPTANISSGSREGGYGSFGHTPPLDRAFKDRTPNIPEMTLPPPIKSISDVQVNRVLEEEDRMVSQRHPLSDNQGRTQLNPTEALSPGATTNRSIRADTSPTASRRPKLLQSFTSRRRAGSLAVPTRAPVTLIEVLAELPPLQLQFFEALDRELIKVQNFYREREKDAIIRSAIIREQLNELKDHRRIFHAYEDQQSASVLPRALGKLAAHLSPSPIPWKPRRNEASIHSDAFPSTSRRAEDSQQPGRLDPDEYQDAKKKLKKAILEFYKGIEYLQNFRILNLTGFRKALKKFEKVTQVQIAQLYHNEKIEPSILSSPSTIDNIASEIEAQFAARFEAGDRKRARERLRAHFQPRNHHFSTFRTGIMVGLSIPPIVAGIYEAYQPYTQQRIPSWSSLLQIYLAFFLPVAFGLLVSLNIIVWAHFRINYIFIFELDVRTVGDSREYAELPAFLLMTLSYSFWFSFSNLSLEVSPTTWPLAWGIFALLFLLNPFPVIYPYSRRWVMRKSAELFLSGTRRVEFQDFFLGDQYCSMVYTLTNFYYMGCLYQSHWRLPWGQCELPLWPLPWLLATLPSWIRFVQCVRRYIDSRQFLQLVNAGKYCSSILYYALYYNWRKRGSLRDPSFVAYIFFGCVMSIYTAAWDILMDWSLMQPGARYPLLRKDLIYGGHIWVYYFAMVTNIVLRFGWVAYLPTGKLGPNTRGGFLAIAEALRRFQWNFFRLENEHLGNADQYRVTREVPLPYSIDPTELSDDAGDEDDPVASSHSLKGPLRFSASRRSPRTPRTPHP